MRTERCFRSASRGKEMAEKFEQWQIKMGGKKNEGKGRKQG